MPEPAKCERRHQRMRLTLGDQMRQRQPDWVFVTGYINDLILIRRQLSDRGIAPKVLSMIAGPAYKEFVEATGPLAENVSSAAWWHPAVAYDGADVFGCPIRRPRVVRKKEGFFVAAKAAWLHQHVKGQAVRAVVVCVSTLRCLLTGSG